VKKKIRDEAFASTTKGLSFSCIFFFLSLHHQGIAQNFF
jgi:hypothetical protein